MYKLLFLTQIKHCPVLPVVVTRKRHHICSMKVPIALLLAAVAVAFPALSNKDDELNAKNDIFLDIVA